MTQMQLDSDVPGDERKPAKGPRTRPDSALETELNKALDRLDHQVTDTRNYLASLDKQTPAAMRRRRKTDKKPSGDRER